MRVSARIGVCVISVLVAALFFNCRPAAGQETRVRPGRLSPPFKTSVTFQGHFGSRVSSGYKDPWTAFGPTVEIYKSRLEMSAGVLWSPTKKALTNDGHSIWLDMRGLYWIRGGRFAVGGGVLYKRFTSAQFVKRGWEPGPIISIRGTMFAVPTRWTFTYLLPTGSSTKVLQDPREQGIRFEMEGMLTRHLKVGYTNYFVTFLDQGNPAFPNLRQREVAGSVMLSFAFVFPSRSDEKPW